MARTSKYLDAKAQNLRSALLYFTDSSNRQPKEDRLVAFLDQIDFWDWELDELLFSYRNFDERAEAFESTEPGQRAAQFGLMVNPKKAKSLQRDRRWDAWRNRLSGDSQKMEAPEDSLAETLTVWHSLLTEAEGMLASDKLLEQAKAAGVMNVSTSLAKYRKG